MKNPILLLSVAMWLLSLASVAQKSENTPAYVKGEIIVRFREGVLDHRKLPVTLIRPARFEAGQVIKEQKLLKELNRLEIKGTRKLVRRSSPDNKVSVSRTGEDVTIPDFYNIAYLYVCV